MKWIKRKIILWLFGYDFPRYVRQFYKEQDQIIKMYSEMLREEAKESNNIISDENGALIIINILYEQGIINKRTYDNILKKYKIT